MANKGIKEILSKLEDEDLFGLTATVTQGLLKNKINSREEAVDSIIKYSPDLFSILKRRIVTRDVLFSYLHENNVSVELPVVKDKLIDRICVFWNLSTSTNEVRSEIRNEVTDTKNAQETRGENDVNVMAQKFSEWFFSLMNQNERIASEHFFSDAKLKLNLISQNQFISEEVEEPAEIVQLLYRTKSQHNLYFNPNLSNEGVQGRIDPHGLVIVLTCGTLHTNNICAGVFEQVFALARDPFCDNNWKIKNVELNLRSKSDISKLPSLCDSDLTSNLLALPES